MRLRFRLFRALAVVAALSVASCLDIEEPPEGLSLLSVSGGNGQTLAVGQTTNIAPLSVLALDHKARPMAGVVVNWSIFSGGGSLSVPSSTTGTDGMASVNYTPGTTAGEVLVRAVASDLAVTFTILVGPANP